MSSYTGCDFDTSTFSNFIYDAEARQTYQQCYILPLDVAEYASVEAPLTTLVRTGIIPVPPPTTTLWRAGTRSLVANGELEVAYRINTAQPGDDSAYICFTSSGSVTAADTCKINRCDLQTTHFAAISDAACNGDPLQLHLLPSVKELIRVCNESSRRMPDPSCCVQYRSRMYART